MDSGYLTTFHLFPKLPMELRLMIWEFTWPPSRVIEATYYEDLDDEEFREITILRLGGSLSGFLKRDFGSRILQDKPLEDCDQYPIALEVCNESRRHTLKKYTALQHEEYRAGSFWFSPYYDFLWFSHDFTDEICNIGDIEDYYGDQLNLIENVLVEDTEWSYTTPADYTENYLCRFDNIKNLFVLCGTFDNNDRLVLPQTNLLRLSGYDRNEYARWEELEELEELEDLDLPEIPELL